MLFQEHKTSFDLVIDALRVTAQLLWPCTILVALVLFRGEIRSLVSRLRRGKFLGQELELAEEAQKVDKQVEAAEKAEPVRPLGDPSKNRAQELIELQYANDRTRQFLDEAAKDKRLALLRIWIEIEQELKVVVATYGFRQFVSRPSARAYVQVLSTRKIISQETATGILAFYEVRNGVLHGRLSGGFADSDLVALIDSGLRLLEILTAIPRETYRVKALVPFFPDQSASIQVEGANAVILDTTLAEGKHTDRVYPTTQVYKSGQLLSWEWNLAKSWGPSWYQDPQTGEIKHGWSSSAEFIGRPLEDI